MSVINQMLQDLERRNATADRLALPDEVRPLPAEPEEPLTRRAFAWMSVIAASALIGWLSATGWAERTILTGAPGALQAGVLPAVAGLAPSAAQPAAAERAAALVGLPPGGDGSGLIAGLAPLLAEVSSPLAPAPAVAVAPVVAPAVQPVTAAPGPQTVAVSGSARPAAAAATGVAPAVRTSAGSEASRRGPAGAAEATATIAAAAAQAGMAAADAAPAGARAGAVAAATASPAAPAAAPVSDSVAASFGSLARLPPLAPTALAPQMVASIAPALSALPASPAVPQATALAAPASAAARAGVDASPPRIERQEREPTLRERAEIGYRRGVEAMHEGRRAAAEQALREALSLVPAHEAARQTLLGMLVEQRRLPEAEALLVEAQRLNPAQVIFAMALARLQVERGDLAAALESLQRSAAAGRDRADFLGFNAGLLARAGRHADAVAQYQAALRIAPQAGVWWMGLGIALDADRRPVDAAEAFQRARESNSLAPELTAYVERRLRGLQGR